MISMVKSGAIGLKLAGIRPIDSGAGISGPGGSARSLQEGPFL